jgi:hypothetical protein
MFSVSQIDEANIIDVEEVHVLEWSCGSVAKKLIVASCRSICDTSFGDPALFPTPCMSISKVDQA